MEKKNQWNTGYWIVALLLLLSLQSYWQTAKTVEPVPYSEFEKALAEGRVAEVLVSDRTVTGRLKSPDSRGKTTIVANTYTTTLRCDVTVVSNVGRVTLNQERLYLENIGGTAALRASVAVENGDAVPITWTTSNPAAATVDPFGLVTAVGDGEALITATTPDGHSACCNVYCGTQVAIQEQIEADEAKIALGVLGGFAVLVGALALAVSGS